MTIEIYHAETLEKFNTWHDNVKSLEGITAGGIIGLRNGVPDASSQKTVAYSEAVPHPTTSDFYYWFCGDYPDEENFENKTKDDLGVLGFLTDNGEA